MAFCSGGDQALRTRDGYVDNEGFSRLNVLDLQVDFCHKKIIFLGKLSFTTHSHLILSFIPPSKFFPIALGSLCQLVMVLPPVSVGKPK